MMVLSLSKGRVPTRFQYVEQASNAPCLQSWVPVLQRSEPTKHNKKYSRIKAFFFHASLSFGVASCPATTTAYQPPQGITTTVSCAYWTDMKYQNTPTSASSRIDTNYHTTHSPPPPHGPHKHLSANNKQRTTWASNNVAPCLRRCVWMNRGRENKGVKKKKGRNKKKREKRTQHCTTH